MTKLAVSKRDWIRIGKAAGWFTKKAYHSETVQEALDNWRSSGQEDQDAITFLFSVKHLLMGGEGVSPGVMGQVDKILAAWEQSPMDVMRLAENLAVQLGYEEKHPHSPVPSKAELSRQKDVMRQEPHSLRPRLESRPGKRSLVPA